MVRPTIHMRGKSTEQLHILQFSLMYIPHSKSKTLISINFQQIKSNYKSTLGKWIENIIGREQNEDNFTEKI